MPFFAVLIATVILVSPFGEASGAVVDDDRGLLVEVTVEYSKPAEAVIARPYSDFEELLPTALAQIADTTWGGYIQLPTAADWTIGFEAFGSDGEANVSDGATLSELGVDPVLIDDEILEPSAADQGLRTSTFWLFVGVGLAGAALVVLGIWVLVGNRAEREAENLADEDPETEEVEAGE